LELSVAFLDVRSQLSNTVVVSKDGIKYFDGRNGSCFRNDDFVVYAILLIARERDLLMHSIWHPILVMETEKVLEIFSFCGSGPKRLNEITVTFFHVPFLASVTTHGA
jgi:hypothetical protein